MKFLSVSLDKYNDLRYGPTILAYFQPTSKGNVMDIQLVYKGAKTTPQPGDTIVFDPETRQACFRRGQDTLFMIGAMGNRRPARINFWPGERLDEIHARLLFTRAGLSSGQIVRVPIVGNAVCFGVTSSSGVAA
jgi:hypothetical protein